MFVNALCNNDQIERYFGIVSVQLSHAAFSKFSHISLFLINHQVLVRVGLLSAVFQSKNELGFPPQASFTVWCLLMCRMFAY